MTLLANAKYWRAHDEPKVALKELQRALVISPDNADALAAAADISLQLEDYDGANKYAQALARVAPSDPRLPALTAEHQLSPAEAALLAEARKLATDGNMAASVERFKQLFKGAIPPSLRLEYYDILGASSQEGFDEAHDKLGQLAAQAPDSDPVQLAYARLLIKQEETRNEGIRILTALSNKPDVSKAARESWRDVLLWQGPSEKARGQIMAYLQDNPHDPEIDAKLRAFDQVLPDEGHRALMRGYYEAATDPAKAEEDFKTALRYNPNDADALIMMAALRRSQGRPAEAQLYIDKALAIAPARREELLVSAGGDYPGVLPLNVREQVEIARLTTIGDYDTAAKLLTRLYQGREQPSTYNQLGNIQFRAGRLDDAEAAFRQAKTMDPRNADADCGLADVLGRKGNYADAEAALTEAAALYGKAKNKSGARRVDLSRAGLLEDKAAKLDPAATIALYQNGLAADPRNLYVRVELARALQAVGQDDQAATLMTKGVDLARNDPEALRIATELASQFTMKQRVEAEIKAARRGSLEQTVPRPGSQPVAQAAP